MKNCQNSTDDCDVMEPLKLDPELHIKYWKRCLKSLLPTEYTSTDSSRMTLGFFILSALDILGHDAESLPEDERANIRDWILRCQHPNGGFCGSPNHRYPDGYYIDVGHGKQLMDPANLPATYFAILSLSFVGRLDKVRRLDCLRWLKSLQREDGSFGELITADGVIEGGKDMRHCYVAAAVRWLLRGDVGEEELEDDINVQKLVGHLQNGQTYDGGISESSKHEAHAGYTYCAVASLSLLNRLPHSSTASSLKSKNPRTIPATDSRSLIDTPAMIRWLVSRQTRYNVVGGESDGLAQHDPRATVHTPSGESQSLAELPLDDSEWVGFNGRCNKMVDTCYAFWVGASLDLVGQRNLINHSPIRQFLLDQTQHRIGGFGKTPGSPPDIYHSYLGLAALATMEEPGLKSFDPALCATIQQKEKINAQRKESLAPTRVYWKHGYRFSIREGDPDFDKTIAGSEEPPNAVLDALKALN